MPKRKAPQETEASRCMRILDLINFESLRSRISAPQLLPEYKRFLALKVSLGDLNAVVLSPPADIDAIWHAHILDTRHYRTVCEALGGGFIDHDPNGGSDVAARDARRLKCLAEYKKAFGQAPEVWSSVRPVLAPQSHQQQNQRENQRENDDPPPPTQKKPRTRPPAAQPASELAVGSYVLVQRQIRGRGGRRSMRQKGGWVMEKAEDGEAYVVICFEDMDEDVAVIHESEKIMLVPAQKPVPAWATAACDAGPNKIFISVTDQAGRRMRFRPGKNQALQSLMQDFCNSRGIARNSVRFLFDGQRLSANQTPAELQMWPFDVIDVMYEQQGC